MSALLPANLELPVPPDISWEVLPLGLCSQCSLWNASFSLILPFKLRLILQSPTSNGQYPRRLSLTPNSKLLCHSQLLAHSQAQLPRTQY